jgi:signal transduction histidine kinase
MACFMLTLVSMPTRPTVLIVDDELGVRESLRAILSHDCQVRTASCGEDALAAIEREKIDLVTLDLRMPGMGGISVLEAIKRHDEDIEVLIITGYGSFDTAVQGLRNRAFDYISKPFDSDQVRRLVQAALARRSATQRLRTAPDNILSTLSHEFRTPLNVIMGYSSMLREDGETELNEEQRRALDRIEANSTTLLSYVETLFYMVELDRGLVPTTTVVLDLGRLLEAIAKDHRAAAKAKGLAIEVAVPEGLALRSDGEMAARALSALVGNAVRYTEAGAVRLVAVAVDGGVRLTVEDTGVGMSGETIAEAERVADGTPSAEMPRLLGFGLRLVGRLVRVLDGRLVIESRPGATRCTLALPNRAVDTADVRASA